MPQMCEYALKNTIIIWIMLAIVFEAALCTSHTILADEEMSA